MEQTKKSQDKLASQPRITLVLSINKIEVQCVVMYINKVISFIPCFKYEDSDDIILFASKNIYFHLDNAGQYNENFYGMKNELIEHIYI